MQFHEIINAKFSKESDRAMMQKDAYPVNAAFSSYLQQYGRDIPLPVIFSDLVNYSYADALKDKRGKWTHWENAVYEPNQWAQLAPALVKCYLLLKSHQEVAPASQYAIERIDFCEYGNSIPFRIKITQQATGQYDFFYIKQADASRIYGLELEHLLTNNLINYRCFQDTLVEEHIGGTPGDNFLLHSKQLTVQQQTNLARAFVQFNESCFARLLGDMRSYNFVVNKERGPNENTYRFRAIDFDQQCYEGRKNLYFPQFYKENIEYVEMVLKLLTPAQIIQAQQLEHAAMAERIITYRRQLMELVNSMVKDDISENYKIQLLRSELNLHFTTDRFTRCKTMGEVVKQQLKQVLQKQVQQVKLTPNVRQPHRF